MDRKAKKDRVRAWKEQEREAAREGLPLLDGEMEALFDMLDVELSAGCNHTRRLIDAWRNARGHPMEDVHRWLDDNGGFCDCEVLANAEEAWRDATRRK